MQARDQQARQAFGYASEVLSPGQIVTLSIDDADTLGVVVSVKDRKSTQMPMGLSRHTAKIAVPTASREVTVTFGDAVPMGLGGGQSGISIENFVSVNNESINDLLNQFDAASKSSREKRFMMTGNIVSGYELAGAKGQIMQYSDENGNVKPGVLMPRTFEYRKFMNERPVRLKTADQVFQFMNTQTPAELQSADGILTLKKNRYGDYEVAAPKAARRRRALLPASGRRAGVGRAVDGPRPADGAGDRRGHRAQRGRCADRGRRGLRSAQQPGHRKQHRVGRRAAECGSRTTAIAAGRNGANANI